MVQVEQSLSSAEVRPGRQSLWRLYHNPNMVRPEANCISVRSRPTVTAATGDSTVYLLLIYLPEEHVSQEINTQMLGWVSIVSENVPLTDTDRVFSDVPGHLLKCVCFLSDLHEKLIWCRQVIRMFNTSQQVVQLPVGTFYSSILQLCSLPVVKRVTRCFPSSYVRPLTILAPIHPSPCVWVCVCVSGTKQPSPQDVL